MTCFYNSLPEAYACGKFSFNKSNLSGRYRFAVWFYRTQQRVPDKQRISKCSLGADDSCDGTKAYPHRNEFGGGRRGTWIS
jgi:hypothetical protein